jgi:hypothetical protein
MFDVDLSELVAAAARLQSEWDSTGIRFCFIGGLAVQHWGQPRQTNDVDATVWTDFGNERPVIDRLLEQLTGRIDKVAEFALQNRVLLVQDSSGVDVDISLAAFPFEKDLIDRSQHQRYRDIQLRICGPNDLVILKAFANRHHDWLDIRGILIRSGHLLDWHLIEKELAILAELKEEPEILRQLTSLRETI